METDYVSTTNSDVCDKKSSTSSETGEVLEKDEKILSIERWPPYG